MPGIAPPVGLGPDRIPAAAERGQHDWFDHPFDVGPPGVVGAELSALAGVERSGRTGLYQIWLYAHLPLTLGLTAVGIEIELAVGQLATSDLPASERWLLGGAIAMCFLALGAIHLTTANSGSAICRRTEALNRFGAVPVVLVVAALSATWPSLLLMALIAGVGGAEIGLDLHARRRKRGADRG